MGENTFGQLGDGASGFLAQTNRPEQIISSNFTAIAAGDTHSLILKSDGGLWAVGGNWHGELGDGTFNSASLPEQIVVSNVTAIAAGGYHSLFFKSDGSLWVMGYDQYGVLGDGATNSGNYYINIPEQIVASNVTAIAAGGGHSLFLKSDGSLWAMGNDFAGQLGDGGEGFNIQNTPEQIVASNVTAIAGGGEHNLFLKSDGSLWAMGYNFYGQLGDGTYGSPSYGYATNRPEQIVASNVTVIAAGDYHSLFLKNDGSLWVMGDNEYGQLGDGTTNNVNRPEQIVASGVTAIAAGAGHSLFLKSDGSLWAMGYNGDGELGDGTLNNTNQPEQILGPYNQIQITGQSSSGTNMQLSFVGIALKNYALDRASSLSPPNWIPQATNAAGSFGALVFTNPPDATTNNFWRIRSVP
jgi:alpha-tubulin suppressor-like RCC1 family protein